VYVDEESERAVTNPAKKAAKILAKEAFSECLDIYAEILRETVSMRMNAHLFNMHYVCATWNILDFVDKWGAFKFKDMEEAKEILGIKALAIEGFTVTMHPRDPDVVMTVPTMANRAKNMKELAKFSKFYGELDGGAGGKGLGAITLITDPVPFNKNIDEINRGRLGIVEEK